MSNFPEISDISFVLGIMVFSIAMLVWAVIAALGRDGS